MNLLNLLLGIAIILLSIFYIIYRLKIIDKSENDDYMSKYYNVKLIAGGIGFIILGIYIIYSELKSVL